MSYIDYAEEARQHRLEAQRHYYRARADTRRATEYEGYARNHDDLAGWWSRRVGTIADEDGDAAEQAELHRKDAEVLRHLAQTVRDTVPKSRERARFYNDLARSYDKLSENEGR